MEDQNTAETNTLQEHDTCLEQLKQLQQKYIYLQAEIDNYKKRVEKERGQWIQSAQALVLTDILPIVDDFDRALEQAGKTPELAKHVTGFEMIEKELQKFLRKYDVQEIPYTNTFDAHLHEAIMQTKSDSHQSGDIVQTLQKGYTFKGQVLRPAKVSVAE